MKHRYQVMGIFSLLSLAVVAGFLFSGSDSAAAGDESREHTLWASYWTVEPGFTSTLEIKNNRAEETLSVQVSLYFASGEEYYLDPRQLGPRQTAVINLNQVYESLPASVRARAGTEGTLKLGFNGVNFQAVMGSISVSNPERGIAWVFRLYPRGTDLPVLPVRGLFWFPDAQTDGFVAVQNASEEYIDVTPLFHVGGEARPLAPFSLAPGQGSKLELRRELRSLGWEQVSAGGIELTYEGPSDAVKAHGVLFNNQGFSTEIDFHFRKVREEERLHTMRTPRFAVGTPDPALGLPGATSFEPVLALHNFGESELPITLAVGYRGGEGPAELQVPLTISAGDTEVVSLHPYLEGVVPEEANWASLEVSYTAVENALAVELVSVSADGEHSIRSVMNTLGGSASEGWYWRADADHNTYITMFNADTEEATVNVSLDYYDQGQRQSYDLPELVIPARVAELIDVGALIAAGVPDADGDVIPSEVGLGGYRVRKVGRRMGRILTTESLVFNRRTHNYLTFYNTCCWIFGVNFTPSLLGGFPGAGGQINIFGTNSCGGNQVNLTTSGDFFSFNTSVATVGVSTGTTSFVAPGSTDIDASVEHWDFVSFFDPCILIPAGALVATLVDPPPTVTVSLSSPTVAPQGQTMVTVSTSPATAGLGVSLSRTEVANSGGHLHLSRPLGSLAASSGTTNSQGKFTTTYTASLFGGAEKISASAGGGSGNATLTVDVTGLSLLGSGTNYALVGATSTHPVNHYGNSTTNSKLPAIANQYAAQFPGSVLNYNDMSLARGGLFDIGPPFGALWNTPHVEHRLGKNCDISKSNVPSGRWSTLEIIFTENNATFLQESDHWHLIF